MSEPLDRLASLVERLREECPWDREQTFATLQTYLLEETHEVLEALESEDGPRLRGELGDLLFQIFFLCRLARERGWFDADEVASAIEAKMIERHPHVFGSERASDAASVKANWERRKRVSGESSEDPLEGIPASLPALSAAFRMSARAADLGFDWERDADVLAKVEEEIAEARNAAVTGSASSTEEELGDVLFTVVNWARRLGIDPERALRGSNAKFRRRFARVAEKARLAGKDVAVCSPGELDLYWNEVKAQEEGARSGVPTRKPA